MMANRSRRAGRLLAGGTMLTALWLSGCTSQEIRDQASASIPESTSAPSVEAPVGAGAAGPSQAAAASSELLEPQIYRGTGNFINRGAARGDVRITGAQTEGATLNFESAEIREVAQLILGDTLQENYIIDESVRGNITLRTSAMLDREALLSVLEMVLQINGAALIYRDGLYRIVPMAGALQGTSGVGVGTRPTNAGYQARLIELRFIAAEEMARILDPFFSTSMVIEPDPTRNLLMAAGTAAELAQLGQLIELFDVDVLSGMSVGVFPLHNVDTASMETELRALIGTEDNIAMARMIRILPVERLNALMIVSPQPSYLETIQTWIERLDVATDGGGRRLYVYRVQNVRAGDLAGILRELFGIGETQAAGPAPALAPGATPRIIQTRPDETLEETAAAVQAVGVVQGSELFGEPGDGREVTVGDQNGDAGTVGDVSIIADDSSNTLVVLAKPGDYSRIESAIRQLDVMPLQVLLETTIAEVSLTDEFSYGMQWFFDHNTGDSRIGTGVVGLPLAFPGSLSYSIVNSADEVRAILRILATEDKLRVVSAPSVLVMDNQTASIRVGNQQPVSTAIVAEGGIVSTSVQFKNTGITLDVTPRVNASGLVTLEISQELTDVGQIDDATGQRAFLQRSIGSNVAVNSGESIVLGGLIRENDTMSRSGVPFLHKIPVIGGLFGQRVHTNDRTELLVLLTATVIQNATEAQGLIEEFRRKMPSLFPLPAGFSPRSLTEGAGTEEADDATEPSADSTIAPSPNADDAVAARS